MKPGLVGVTACSLMLLAAAGYLPAASAQGTPQDIQAPAYAAPQLDQLLAPIALYPDPLLGQILMASTYPLEVVEAARWLQDPSNASLRGQSLDAALQQQNWDPSVKSLVPFPQVLQMMNSKLDWTEALGNAFLAQQAGVMDSVQRLRGAASTAGTLRSTPQETVSTEGQTIVIEPANPQFVYVPYYNPMVVYGAWGYPDYPPIWFPPPPGYGYVAGPGITFGVGFGIIGALWGWDRWDWSHHDLHIDPDRYNRINEHAIAHDNRPRSTTTSWQHDPVQRGGVPYGNPALRQQFRPSSAGSAGSADTRRAFRGFASPGGATPGPANPSRAATPAPVQRPSPAVAPAFSSFGRGPDVRAQSQRGQASRQSMPAASPQRFTAPQPRAMAPQQRSAPPQMQHGAPSGGGQRGGGGGRERH